MTAIELASQIGATFHNEVKCEVKGISVACKLMIDHDPLPICRALKEAGIESVVKGKDTIVFIVNPMFVCSAEECALALHYTVKRLKGLLWIKAH